MDDLVDEPTERVYFTNIDTNDELAAQFNPTELEESLGVTWAKQTVTGLSHQVKQFSNTEDRAFSLSLYFDAIAGAEQAERNLKARRFLEAHCFPKRAPGDIKRAGPPRLVFVWPHVRAVECVLVKVKFRYTQFVTNAAVRIFTADVQFEEILDALVTFDDVMARDLEV